MNAPRIMFIVNNDGQSWQRPSGCVKNDGQAAHKEGDGESHYDCCDEKGEV